MAALSAGTRLGFYEVKAPLGAGGMGEVYLARDPRLERDVALKVLPAAAVADPTSRERLVREARAVASMSHPNICAVYDVGEASGHVYIAMEFLQGETLAARLARPSGGLSPAEIMYCGAQIAAALTHAHARNVVHRDLKPANVVVTPDGWVKVLDFGLARRSSNVNEATPTEAPSLTEAGAVAGTPQYLAPEVLLGHKGDARSDIWALGVVLYELVGVGPPFSGRTSYGLSAAILREDAAPLPDRVPVGLRTVISRCLRKAPEERYASAAEVRAALEALQSGRSAEPVTPPAEAPPVPVTPTTSGRGVGRGLRSLWAVGVLAVLALAVAVVFWGDPRRSPVIAPTQRQVTFTGQVGTTALSPDGKTIAFHRSTEGGEQLVVQDISSGSPIAILGPVAIVGTGADDDDGPRWSPDGSTVMTPAVASMAESSSVMGTYLVPRLGGTPRVLSATGTIYAWSPDGRRVAVAWHSNPRLWFHDLESGGTSSFVLAGDIVRMLSIDWSEAHGRLLALTQASNGLRDLWTIRPDGRQQRRVASGRLLSARWACSGKAIYCLDSKGQTADLIRIDVRRDGSAAGTPATLYPGLRRASALSPARDGRSAAFVSAGASTSSLYVLASKGKPGTRGHTVRRQLTEGTSNDAWPCLSPDGRWIAFTRVDERGTNVYVMPFEGGAARRLTFGAASCESPVWSRDGKELAFVSDEGGLVRIWHVPVQGGAAKPCRRVSISDRDRHLAWAPGARVMYSRQGDANIGLLDPATGVDTVLLRNGPAGLVFGPEYSPDGTKVAAYWLRADGRHGIWEFVVGDSTQRRIREAWSFPGSVLSWSRDGRSIYAPDPSLMRIPANGLGQPEAVLDVPAAAGTRIASVGELPNGVAVMFCVASSVVQDAWLLENLPVPRRWGPGP